MWIMPEAADTFHTHSSLFLNNLSLLIGFLYSCRIWNEAIPSAHQTCFPLFVIFLMSLCYLIFLTKQPLLSAWKCTMLTIHFTSTFRGPWGRSPTLERCREESNWISVMDALKRVPDTETAPLQPLPQKVVNHSAEWIVTPVNLTDILGTTMISHFPKPSTY